MSSYRLIYFDLKALAEVSRVMFYFSGTQYEDFRYPNPFQDKTEYAKAKEAGEFTNNEKLPPPLFLFLQIRHV